MIARDFGSDKLVNSNLICRTKVDNVHCLVAHSARVPSYSTQFVNIKIRNYDCPINSSALVKSSHVTINQKDCVFGHVLSLPWYHGTSFLLHVGLLTSASPAALQHMHTCHLCWKHQLTSIGSKQCCISQIFLGLCAYHQCDSRKIE